MWLWSLNRNIWLSAVHQHSTQNVQADQAFQIFHDQTEWKLDKTMFEKVTARPIMPEVDKINLPQD